MTAAPPRKDDTMRVMCKTPGRLFGKTGTIVCQLATSIKVSFDDPPALRNAYWFNLDEVEPIKLKEILCEQENAPPEEE